MVIALASQDAESAATDSPSLTTYAYERLLSAETTPTDLDEAIVATY